MTQKADLIRDIRAELLHREGRRRDVYYDSKNIPTVGIGHKVLTEDNLKIGDWISSDRVEQFFTKDTSWAIDAAMSNAKEMGVLRYYNFVLALVSVNFQLGAGWKHTFYGSYPKLLSGDYKGAIRGFKRSDWAKETPVRVDDFVHAIENLIKDLLHDKIEFETHNKESKICQKHTIIRILAKLRIMLRI